MRSGGVFAAAVLLLTGCGADDPRGAAGAAVEAPGEAIAERPEVREDTMLIEGMPEVQRATLVQSPADFALPFSTYVPEGMRPEFLTDSSVRFAAAFGGIEHPNAYMHVHVYEPEVRRPTVHDVVTGFVQSRGLGLDESVAVEGPAWALEARRFAYIGTGAVPLVGRALTGQHNDRFFHVIIHYPAEYGDGMGPRVEYILRHWRWEDTGEMLVN